jgi:hypothetical protein
VSSGRFASDVPEPTRRELGRTARNLRPHKTAWVEIRCHGGDGAEGSGTLLGVVVPGSDPIVTSVVTGADRSGGVLVTASDMAHRGRRGPSPVWCPRCRVTHRIDLPALWEVVDRCRVGAPPGGWPWRFDVGHVVTGE